MSPPTECSPWAAAAPQGPSTRSACAALAPDGGPRPGGGKESEAQGERSSCTLLEQFSFAAQVSSSSTCSTAVDIASSDFLSRQCTEIDALAQFAWSDSALEDAVREATAQCRFSVTVADPRRRDFPLIAVSEEFEAMTGFKREEIIGKNCRFLNHGCDLELSRQQALREACSTGCPFTALLLNRRKSGDMFLNLLDLRGLTVAHNPRTGAELWFLVGIQADVSGLAEEDYPEDHLPKLSQVAAAIRERITFKISHMAVAGALAAEAACPTRTADSTNSWYPLNEPLWKAGQASANGQASHSTAPPPPLAAALPKDDMAADSAPAAETADPSAEMAPAGRPPASGQKDGSEQGGPLSLLVGSRPLLAASAVVVAALASFAAGALVQLARLRS